VSRFDLITPKLERAERHIRDLEAEIRIFFNSNPYEILGKDDVITRQRSYYVRSVRDISPETVAIAGDAIHNLRGALDHLAFQLVWAGGGRPDKHTCFPVSEDAAKYNTESPRKVKGMGKAAKDAIDAIKPYNGGNFALWRLHRLDIIDKHRMFITAGSAVKGHSLLPAMRKRATENWLARNRGVPVPDFRQPFGRPHVVCYSMKAGDLILSVPEAEVEENMKFRFDVVFNEPPVIEGEPILEALHHFSNLVGQIIVGFAPLL
jgi:hypothetical protein